jgi:histidinol phosphatase-like enzyme (inositol monophosphatase family)
MNEQESCNFPLGLYGRQASCSKRGHRTFSTEVDTGPREGNAIKQERWSGCGECGVIKSALDAVNSETIMTLVALDHFFGELAEASGAVILPFFRMNGVVVNKIGDKGFDPVTEADRAAELVIRDRIKRAFPDYAIRGEEFGVENEGAEYEWIIDPIDGTRGFICGLPTWGTLVGLMRNGKPVQGMMNQPFIGERFLGDGRTARLVSTRGERRLAARRCTSLAEATIATTSPRIIMGDDSLAYDRLEAHCRVKRYGTDCYAYAMVAAGQIDLVCETGLQSYDIAPLIPIIEGAGGIVTTWTGDHAANGGSIIAAGDPALHEQAIRVLSGR